MAQQKTIWCTDRGEAAKSYADALMGDAADALTDFADRADPTDLDFEMSAWLLDNLDQLLPLLQAYADAKAERHREIHGGQK